MKFDISEELKKLPDKPGVYIMHDSNDTIIYVGKAVVLKNRVRSYFRNDRNHTPKVRKMVSQIAWFEYIVVDSEMEALVLECNLIKEHRPKYNTMLKDDKHYPYIKVTNEMYPRVMLARDRKKDGGKYFGPYTSAQSVHDTIDLLKKTYGIRSCSKKLDGKKQAERPCLYHFMGQCPAPCMGDVDTASYDEAVGKCIYFLNGNYDVIIKELTAKMKAFSGELEFERAAEIRNLIASVERLSEQQKADECDNNDRDILAARTDNGKGVVSAFFMREGKLVGREHFYLTGISESEPEILESFIKQFYSGTPHIPKEIYVSTEVPETELIENWLTKTKGSKVVIHVPKRGDGLRLIELAGKNARMVLEKDEERLSEREMKTTGALNEINTLLNLDGIYRIESYDISNTGGFENVASMVVFEGGKPKKTDYRKFKTRTISGPDDYGSMREVLKRRFEHYFREKKNEDKDDNDSFLRLPDLLLIDGGRGQVNVVKAVLDELHLSIPVCGMVKDDRHRTRGLWFNDSEVPIDDHSEGFFLVTRIQDETHRFAIEYHKALRTKAQTHSVLDDIPGIGKKRRVELMRHYSSLEEIRNASEEELASLPGMNEKAASAVIEFFKGQVKGE